MGGVMAYPLTRPKTMRLSTARTDRVIVGGLAGRLTRAQGVIKLSIAASRISRPSLTIPALPVVMVTGYPDPAIAEQVRAAGVRDYISKDMDLKFLELMLNAAQAAIANDPGSPS